MESAAARGLCLAFLTLIVMPGLAGPIRTFKVGPKSEIAIVNVREGRIRLRRGKRISTIQNSQLLNLGDVIEAENNTSAAIYQAYMPVDLIVDKQSRTIQEPSSPSSPNAIKPEQFSRLKRIYLNAKEHKNEPSPVTMGGPDEAILTLIDLRNTAVSEPTFQWTGVSKATSYRINVYDHNEKVIRTATTSKTRLALPEDWKPLPPGDYKWEVTAQIDNKSTGDPAMYDATAFTVITKERGDEVERDLAAARSLVSGTEGSGNLIYISALIEHKRLAQAANELKVSLERAPHNEALWEMLLETYAEMKLWGARESARDLSKRSIVTAEMIRALEARR